MRRAGRLLAPLVGLAALLGGTGTAHAGCDLKAVFLEPGRTHRGPDVPVAVRMSSIGSDACRRNAVTLVSYVGPRASGYAREVGRARALPALEPGESETLRFEDEGREPGTYTYALRYASPHSDDDNANHRPTHTVEVR